MKIVSTNIGEKREINWKGKLITTGIFKFPVKKSIFLDIEDVQGDVVVDRKYHGGIDQAVYAYGLQYYAYWKRLYPDLDWQEGMFGENLTIDNLDETTIHIGDTFKVGETILEVTKPREPCMKLGVRFNDMKIVKQFWNTTKCGVYFKIIKKGFVKNAAVFQQITSFPENPTIAEVYLEKRARKTSN